MRAAAGFGPVAAAVALVCATLGFEAAAADECAVVARVVSTQGQVEVRRNGGDWRSAALNAPLCAGDSLRVAPRGRAALALPNETLIRLDQGTTVTLWPDAPSGPTLIDQPSGGIHVITRTPRPFNVRTPFVNANVEGTEFVTRVDAGGASVAVIEGHVVASNALGSVRVGSHEVAQARSNAAPQREVLVRSLDSVQWAVHVPTVLAGLAERGEPLDAALDRQAALAPGQRDPQALVGLAQRLLTVGRIDQAEPLLREAAGASGAARGDALALLAVVAVARNDKDGAQRWAREALAAGPTPTSWLALSVAQQAQFDLDGARASARAAVEAAPGHALALARLAELELAGGDVRRAAQHAERAAAIEPASGRTLAVLGFVQLAQYRTAQAERTFGSAVEADSADPSARLGLGLALIRQGRLPAGREQVEIATSLDPARALVRTYLGKAYFEEYRGVLADTQWSLAIEADPLDPTPWFYQALGKQAANRPVEALADIEKSIALNRNRAVYRSLLLLDQDEAARTASKAKIYSDLGFDKLALLAGNAALAEDPSGFAAHRLLADAFVDSPRHDVARVSELLQSQLRQPLTFAPTQLQFGEDRFVALRGAGPGSPGLNEYNALFTRDGIGASASGIAGSNATFGDQLLLSGIAGRWGLSAGHLNYRTDGFRENDDFRQTIDNLFVQYEANASLGLQAEVRRSRSFAGDTVLRFDPDLFLPDRNALTTTSYRLGGSYRFDAASELIASAAFIDGHFTNGPPDMTIVDQTLRTRVAELQYVRRGERIDTIAGLGAFSERTETSFFGTPVSARPEGYNVYVYANVRPSGRALTLHLGLSADRLNAGDGLGGSKTQVNPKLGLTWQPSADTTVRAAAFRTLKRRFQAAQTLEPTQLAGFNQFYDDLNGTDARRVGLGVDQRFTPQVHAGIELSQRKLRVPQDFVSGEVFDWREREASAYAYWTPERRVALSARYVYERFDRTPDFPGQELFVNVTTQRVPLTADLRLPSGFSARLRTTHVQQRGEFYTASNPDPTAGSDRFWITDASLSWRLPNRRGFVSLDAKNIFDRRFRYQETDLYNPVLARSRAWFVRASVYFD